jgi:hypothetical protein
MNNKIFKLFVLHASLSNAMASASLRIAYKQEIRGPQGPTLLHTFERLQIESVRYRNNEERFLGNRFHNRSL